MHRFFVTPDQVQDREIEITGENYHHLVDVLRIREQENFEICDGSGKDYLCCIQEKISSKKIIIAKILDTYPSKGELPYRLVLFQGLAKGKKMDDIIQKGTELGVCDFVPFDSKFCVVHLNERAADKKVERWQKIAKSAAQQSKRGIIPKIHHPVHLSSVNRLEGTSLVAYENEQRTTLKEAVKKWQGHKAQINLFVGPEGGFSEDEIEALKNNDVECVTLGKRILRTETAGIVFCSQLNFVLE
jgi:16S rRNA (uracil1498-N3)-methyltransferase